MANVDSYEEIEKLDSENYLQTIQDFPAQCEKAWSDWKKIPLPASYAQAKNVLITGMGGSGIGGRLAAAFSNEKLPIIIRADYESPAWVNKDTLFIISSYSGNTEEPLDCFLRSTPKTNKLISIAHGGQLEILSRKYKTVHYPISYESQPRQSIGFQLTSILAIFNKIGLVEISDDDFNEAILLLRALQKKIDVNMLSPNNNAKLLARRLEGKIPLIYGASVMAQVAYRAKGHFNENSKSLSIFESLPEAHHNAMVGLEFPKNIREILHVLILHSKFDHPRNQLRCDLTLKIMQKRRIPAEILEFEPAPTKLAEMLQAIHFLDFASYYLGIIYNADPAKIEMVKFLKDKLAEKPFEEGR